MSGKIGGLVRNYERRYFILVLEYLKNMIVNVRMILELERLDLLDKRHLILFVTFLLNLYSFLREYTLEFSLLHKLFLRVHILSLFVFFLQFFVFCFRFFLSPLHVINFLSFGVRLNRF